MSSITLKIIPGAEYAIVRPEFVKVTRKNEVQKYKSSASEADVERVAFRGSYFELQLKLGEVVLSARRGLDEPLVRQGEKVGCVCTAAFCNKRKQSICIGEQLCKRRLSCNLMIDTCFPYTLWYNRFMEEIS